jgi:serine/threonine protein phosphatase PrpC
MPPVVLWGHDHVELGVTASAAAPPSAGVAISRGGFAKLYRYVDPNEDVAAAVAGPSSTLLVVADGHNGMTASRVAVESVLEALGDDPPAALSDKAWLELFGEVNEAILAATSASETPHSATALACALVTPHGVSWAAAGDCAVVVSPPAAVRGRQVNKESIRFVGHPMKPRALKSVVGRGTFDRGPDEWVVLATDGFAEFILPDRPADLVPRLVWDARGDAERAARGVVEHACSRGAGDNVAVAACAPA